MKTATATAHSNIALVKYWGKRSDSAPELNLPAVGSLSMTLDALRTETAISPAREDELVLDGAPAGASESARVVAHLDRLWASGEASGRRPRCRVVSVNHFPTAAGLASSASGFAALTLAGATAFELGHDRAHLAALARMGSGSAARSIYGGFVRLDRGVRSDGGDCTVRQLAGPEHWPLRLVVVQTTRQKKPVGSTEGMKSSAETSPYYTPWVETSLADLDAAQTALRDRDLEALGAVVEHSCFKMHACMMASVPALLYWNGATVAAIRAVWEARRGGLPGFVTIDAGPHVKVLCEREHSEAIASHMKTVPGVEAVTIAGPGPDATGQVASSSEVAG